MLWFTADTHFDHANIIKYCNRPFKDVDHMNETLIANWNQVVAPEDTVYHLGDFGFKHSHKHISRLNGHKILLMGNHDRLTPELKEGFEQIVNHKAYWHLDLVGESLALNHYPPEPEDYEENVFYLHGHCHGALLSAPFRIDVGVDCWDYRPISFEMIRERAQWPQNPLSQNPLSESLEKTKSCLNPI